MLFLNVVGTFKTSSFLDVVLTFLLGYKNVIRTLRNNTFRLYWTLFYSTILTLDGDYSNALTIFDKITE